MWQEFFFLSLFGGDVESTGGGGGSFLKWQEFFLSVSFCLFSLTELYGWIPESFTA